MPQPQNINNQEETDIRKIIELVLRNYRLFLVCIVLALLAAFGVNHYLTPLYKISSSILIKEENKQPARQETNDYLNSSLLGLGSDRNFQNELWILKSSPVLETTIRNLGLQTAYFKKKGFRYIDLYKFAPFRVQFVKDHIQPVGIRFYITFTNEGDFYVTAESKEVQLFDFAAGRNSVKKKNWTFHSNGRFGGLIETPDAAFIIEKDTLNKSTELDGSWYAFEFSDVSSIKEQLKKAVQFNVTDKQATVVEISMKSESVLKGTDILNEIMAVYTAQNLDRKNHNANVTIDYIEKQLNEISDSLTRTETNLQRFRSSNELVDVTNQATGMSTQYMDLKNQLAELVTRKRYYDYVSDYLLKNDNFSNMIVPASLGIQDQLLNTLMSQLIADQAQRSNLIENNQEKNPLVQKLGIQIENTKKTISNNIAEVSRTTNIAIDEMNKRIGRAKADISKLPETQRRLGNIERTTKLNDAIYNYLLEKRAEAKITKASNLPDNIIIDQAKMVGLKPVSPDKKLNFALAILLGLLLPFSFLLIRNSLKNRIETQEDIENLTSDPVLGKIQHNRYKSETVANDFPNSNLAESFRVLRTNLDFYVRGDQKKVILVTSCLDGEGKTFVSTNLALSYSQLGRRTVLVDFDLRKRKNIFNPDDVNREGLSSFLTDKVNFERLINRSPVERLDYIVAGTLPPNPAELIALGRTNELISRLKENYDIIILDTAPLAQVTDAYLLIQHSDLKAIVVRQGSTLKNVFSLIMKDLKLKNINNTCVVMNDNKIFSDQYGYGSGYEGKSVHIKKKRHGRRRMAEYYS